MCPVVAGCARGWFLWVLIVVCRSLCPSRIFVVIIRRLWCCVGQLFSFLDTWDRLTGWHLCDATWERCGGEVDAGCCWAVCQGHGRHRRHGGCLLKKPCHKGVTLA